MTTSETHSPSAHCEWFLRENLSVSENLVSARCLFLSILPYERAVPALILTFVLVTLFSLLVNGITLFVLGRSDDLSWEPRVIFFKNLIVSDILQTVTFGPAVIHSLVHRRTMAFSIWCHIQYCVGTVSIFSSLLTVTCMALERYVYVCHAIHYLVILTRARLRLVLSLIWLYSIFANVISVTLLYTGRTQENELVTGGLLCEPDVMEQHMGFPRALAVFRKLFGCFTLLLCLLVYAFSYLRMYQDARDAMAPFNAVNTRARRTVLFYSGMLILQLLPLLFKISSDAMWELKGTEAMVELSNTTPSTKATVVHMALLVMLFVPPFLNPLVYGLKNREIRNALLGLFGWMTKRRAVGVQEEVDEIRVGNIVPKDSAQEE